MSLKIINKTQNRNAVIVAAGNSSIHKIYTDCKRNYDVILLDYAGIEAQGADKIFSKKGLKFHLIYDFFKENPLELNRYDQYMFPDDDVLLQNTEIEEIFKLAKDYKLDFFHPAITPKNYWHDCMFKMPNQLIRSQNWCETQCIGMSQLRVLQTIETFKINKSGYGLPNLWVSMFGEDCFNIINTIESVHTRPLASGSESCYNQFGGLDGAMKEYYQMLDYLGDNLGGRQTPFRIIRKIYDVPILSIFTIYLDDDTKYMQEYLDCLPDYAQKILIKTVPISEARKYIKNGILPKMYEIRLDRNTKLWKTGIMFVPDEMRYRNFSKMKNNAKNLSDAEWVLNLDLDERLLSHQLNMLREWLEVPENHRNVGGYHVTNLSVMPAAIDEKTGLGSRIVVPPCRLFRKIFDFDDAVHEIVDRVIEKSGMKIIDSLLVMHHRGYEVSSDKLREKAKRNIEILWAHPELMDKPEKWNYMNNTNLFYKQLGG